jgi:hypothetical protein
MMHDPCAPHSDRLPVLGWRRRASLTSSFASPLTELVKIGAVGVPMIRNSYLHQRPFPSYLPSL